MSEISKNFFIFQSPDQLLAEIKPLNDERIFIETGYDIVMEAWIISHFCIGFQKLKHCAVQVKMGENHEEPADAIVKIDNEIVDYQITERQKEGRKRTEEYREWVKKGRPSEAKEYRPIALEEALMYARQAIQKKLDKKYSVVRSTNLLIYLNFDKNNLMLDKLYAHCGDMPIEPFNEVWLLAPAFVKNTSGHAIAKLLPEPNGFFPFVTS
ncbi:MAG: hypothetical protein P9M07_04880 [Candidatus Aceula meridiana]|nr:hypothetical protein [Candidatus Aceula meridiana]